MYSTIDGIAMFKKLLLALLNLIGFFSIRLTHQALNMAEADPLIINTNMK